MLSSRPRASRSDRGPAYVYINKRRRSARNVTFLPVVSAYHLPVSFVYSARRGQTTAQTTWPWLATSSRTRVPTCCTAPSGEHSRKDHYKRCAPSPLRNCNCKMPRGPFDRDVGKESRQQAEIGSSIHHCQDCNWVSGGGGPLALQPHTPPPRATRAPHVRGRCVYKVRGLRGAIQG